MLTHGKESVLLNHTHTRGPSVARMRDIFSLPFLTLYFAFVIKLICSCVLCICKVVDFVFVSLFTFLIVYAFICVLLFFVYLLCCVFVYFTLWQYGPNSPVSYWGQTRCAVSSANPLRLTTLIGTGNGYALLECVISWNSELIYTLSRFLEIYALLLYSW